MQARVIIIQPSTVITSEGRCRDLMEAKVTITQPDIRIVSAREPYEADMAFSNIHRGGLGNSIDKIVVEQADYYPEDGTINLTEAFNGKLDFSYFNRLFELDMVNDAIRAKKPLYSDHELSAHGIGTGGSTGGGNGTVTSVMLGTREYNPDSEGVIALPAYPGLAGYATQDWVDGRGYLTQGSLTGYVTAAAMQSALGGYSPSGHDHAWSDVSSTPDTLSGYGITDAYNQEWVDALLNLKVDKEDGKGLSSNDFTNALLSKLDGIAAGAEVNVQSDWSAEGGDAFIRNKPQSMKSPYALTIKLNGTPQGAYDGGSAKTIDITKNNIGLGNVNNTSDAAKPVSDATQAALNLKLDAETFADIFELKDGVLEIKYPAYSTGEISAHGMGAGGGNGGGTVTSVMLGTREYNPDSEGVIALPGWPSLAGYATQDWVDGRGYLTQGSLTGYVTAAAMQSALGGYSPAGHNHDELYSLLGHSHDGLYSLTGHNHDLAYKSLETLDVGDTDANDNTEFYTTHVNGYAYSPKWYRRKASFLWNYIRAKSDTVYAPKGHVSATDNPHGVTKAQVGLGAVENQGNMERNVLSASKWTTAMRLHLDKGASGSVSVDGSADRVLDVTSLREAYLTWGGKSIADGLSPVDMAMSPYTSPNRFAFANPAGITVEYSNDGGATWADYGLSDTAKVSMVTGLMQTLCFIGKKNNVKATLSDRLRVTFNAELMGVTLHTPRKLHIYCSTNGCTFRVNVKSVRSSDNAVLYDGDYPLSGYSGYNSIPLPGDVYKFGASTDTRPTVRTAYVLEFYATSIPSDSSGGGCVYHISCFADLWTAGSNMAQTGHLYAYDWNQNMVLPRGLFTATDNTGDIGQSSRKFANVYAHTFHGALDGNAARDGSGNVITDTYLPLTGGTVAIGTANDFTVSRTNNNAPLIRFAILGNTKGYLGFSPDGKPVAFGPSGSAGGTMVLLHDSNYQSYALPKTGGTITGNLTVTGALDATATKVGHKLTFTGGVTGTFDGSADMSVPVPYSWAQASTKPLYDFGEINGVVTSGKIEDGAVTNAKIAEGTIANGKLANSSVTLAGRPVSLGGSVSKADMISDLDIVTKQGAQTITGAKTFHGTLHVRYNADTGQYNQGIRLYGNTKNDSWSLVNFGCNPTATTGTHNNQWILGRFGDSSNRFILDVNNYQGNVLSCLTNGNVGMGVLAPAYRLHVGGTAGIESSLTVKGPFVQIGDIRLQYDSANNALKVVRHDGTAANLYSTGEISAHGMGTGGGVGIGGGTVTGDLTVGGSINGSQAVLHINPDTDGDISLCAGGGFVGIGTDFATHKLEVAGSFGATSGHVSGPIYAGTIYEAGELLSTRYSLAGHTHNYAPSTHSHDYIPSSLLSSSIVFNAASSGGWARGLKARTADNTEHAVWQAYGSGNDLVKVFTGGTYGASKIAMFPEYGSVFIGGEDDSIAGNSTPSYTLEVRGDAGFTGAVEADSFDNVSDRRMKTETGSGLLTLEAMRQIPCVAFRWKDGRDGKTHVGTYAQDLLGVLPDVVNHNAGKDVYSVDYGRLGAVVGLSCVNEIHLLKARIEELENELELLKSN